jgi:hypothetical protein
MPGKKTEGGKGKRLPVRLIKERINTLIKKLREKLAGCTEFKDALANNYLYGEGNLREINFRKGGYLYFVFFDGKADLTEEQFEEASKRGVGPYVGWQTLYFHRAEGEDPKQLFLGSIGVNMHTTQIEDKWDKTELNILRQAAILKK